MKRPALSFRSLPVLVLLVVTSVLAVAPQGCGGPSKVVSAWKDPDWSGTVDRVVVYAVRRSPVAQRIWEDAFVAELTKAGVWAAPAYKAFKDGKPDSLEAVAMQVRGPADALLILRSRGAETRTYVVPGTRTIEPAYTYRDPF
jgi:hypothetical protein